MTAPAPLSGEMLTALLPDNVTAHVFDSLDSTNLELRRMAAGGAPAYTLVLAAFQTAGRGRLGRFFHSPSGAGAYFSLLLRPGGEGDSAFITAAAALAAAEACEAVFSVRADIKWVNDVLVRGKKAAGILAEAYSDNGFYVVLGIGANIAPPPGGFPAELPYAGAITETASEYARERFAAETVCRFQNWIDVADNAQIVSEYRRRADMSGRMVTVTRGNERFDALALGIDDALRLVIRRSDGGTERLSYGEVSLHEEN